MHALTRLKNLTPRQLYNIANYYRKLKELTLQTFLRDQLTTILLQPNTFIFNSNINFKGQQEHRFSTKHYTTFT